MNNAAYPIIRLMTPTNNPVNAIYFNLMKPFEYAIAFGGVEIGKHIAKDAERAKPTNKVVAPPNGANSASIPCATATKIGINKAAVAE